MVEGSNDRLQTVLRVGCLDWRRAALVGISEDMLRAVACRGFWRAGPTKKGSYLFRHGFFIGGPEHARGINAVFLSKLSTRLRDPSPVEDSLHRLKDVLCTRRRRSIGLLLAVHYHLDDLAELGDGRLF